MYVIYENFFLLLDIELGEPVTLKAKPVFSTFLKQFES